MNPFDSLGDGDAEDASLLMAANQQEVVGAVTEEAESQPLAKKVPQTQPQVEQIPNLPSKPLPTAQAVKESENEFGRGGGRGVGRGRSGYNRDYNNENSFNNTGAPAGQGVLENGDSGKTSERRSHGAPRGGFTDGEVGDEECPRRHSGTGRGNEIKREGVVRWNWFSKTYELAHAALGWLKKLSTRARRIWLSRSLRERRKLQMQRRRILPMNLKKRNQRIRR